MRNDLINSTEKEFKEFLSNKILENTNEIAEALYCDDTNLTVNVCFDENGKVFSWLHCGNTYSDDVTIISERGHAYSHNCDCCEFCDWEAEELKDKGYDLDTITIKELVDNGEIKKDNVFKNDMKKTFSDYRRQCIIDHTLPDEIWEKCDSWAELMVEKYDKEDLINLFI